MRPTRRRALSRSESSPQGLKPASISHALRSPEGPLFHVARARIWRGLLRGAGDFHGMGASRVAGDAAVEGFGDLFAVAVTAQFLFVGRDC